eukprot:COSAG02_NODE_194_length_29788_cov_20.044090_7_plen_71_part_00
MPGVTPRLTGHNARRPAQHNHNLVVVVTKFFGANTVGCHKARISSDETGRTKFWLLAVAVTARSDSSGTS